MANASSKRIASSNETALKNLQLGALVVNAAAILIRFLFSLFTRHTFIPSKKVIFCQLVATGSAIAVWRWFLLIGSPRRIGREIKPGDDLGGKGIVELAWDLVYMSWICTLGSAILGEWVWWFLLAIPAFGAYKAFNVARPFLGMFLPGLFGPTIPGDPTAMRPDDVDAPVESKRQAKLKARMEKGDKRVQQVQRKQG